MSQTYHLTKFDRVIDLLAIHRQDPQRYPFLLESVANGEQNCRYSILFGFPQEKIVLNKLNSLQSDSIKINSSQFIDGLNQWFQIENKTVPEEMKSQLPFYGGWFVYLGYELAEEIEPVLNLPKNSDINLPIAFASRIPAAIIVDKQENASWIVSEPGFESAYSNMLDDVETSPTQETHLSFSKKQMNEEEPTRYTHAVKQIQEYILEGDVFQVNISRNWEIQLEEKCSASDIYSRLRKSNPAPFAGLMTLDDTAVISSSPERLVSVKNNQVETRPIAGTRPRVRRSNGSINIDADEKLKQELIAHPKERAEHVMLIDLERNDLGRISVPGSVEVDELMVLESYEHVHHIVSNVKGQLQENTLPGDVIRAVFPGGTITGCPKVRCMEIIAELEASPRQAYTGSMGYLNLDGDMDLNILIRTIIHAEDQLHIRAGAGIVAYSDPEKELQETRIKALGMLNALTD